MARELTSKAEEMRKYMMEFVGGAESETVLVADINKYVKEKMEGVEISSGELAQCIKQLVTKGKIERVEKGTYKMGNGETVVMNETLKNKVDGIIKKAVADIQKVGGQVNVFSMTDEERESIEKAKEIIDLLNGYLEN